MDYKAERMEFTRRARKLRNNMTLPEILLWSRIRMRKIDGFKFRRQQKIYNYIVDFYCHELKLIVEVDGEIHYLPEVAVKDRSRDKILKLNGYNVLRLSNSDIKTDLSGSVTKLRSYIRKISSPYEGDHRGQNGPQ